MKAIILLAVYNGERYLEEQIESILLQDYKDLLILARDDCSTDRSVEILEEYQKRDNRVVTVKDSFGNVHGAMNFNILMKFAIDHYPNCVYFFADQDDVWMSGKVSKLVSVLKNEHTSAMVYTNYKVVDKKLEHGKDAYSEKIELTEAQYCSRLLMQNWIMGCTMAFNFPLLKAAYPVILGAGYHDRHVAIVAAFTGKIIYLQDALIYHRVHDNNLTQKSNTTMLHKRIFRIIKRMMLTQKEFRKLILYAEELFCRINENGKAILKNYIRMLISKRKQSVKIMENYQFYMVSNLQNRIFKAQLIMNRRKLRKEFINYLVADEACLM